MNFLEVIEDCNGRVLSVKHI